MTKAMVYIAIPQTPSSELIGETIFFAAPLLVVDELAEPVPVAMDSVPVPVPVWTAVPVFIVVTAFALYGAGVMTEV